MRVVISLAAAGVRFGSVEALKGVTLDIGLGERVALVGANGSGKSSLLRLLHGLVAPTGGRRVADPHVTQAMLFQRPFMLRLTALQNVALALWLRKTPWAQARVLADAALARVELQAVAHRRARDLSGGQQQRLALARAWALKPQVLLLDEPTASLDPHAKREVESLIESLATGDDGLPVTVIFASHNLGQVKRLASRVVYLEQGRVLADMPVAAFFDRSTLQATCPEADLFLKGELA